MSTPTPTRDSSLVAELNDLGLARRRVSRLLSLAAALSRVTAIDEVLSTVVTEVSNTFGALVMVVARVCVSGTDLEVVAGSDGRDADAELYEFPLDVGDERVTGCLTVALRRPRALDEDDRALAVAMATECAMALERTYLTDYVRRAQCEAHSARAVAEDANRSKSDFLAVMSHELRTPLNAIAGYAELIELGVHGPINARQLDAVQRLQRSQRHLLGLINGMLNYARLEAGMVQYDAATFMLGDVIVECTGLVAQQAEAKRQRVIVDKGERVVAVRADRDKVEQVLLNLLSNAIKFTEADGAIEVRHRATDGVALIEVGDTGRGMAANQLERVFEPFVQVDSRLTRNHGGVGLGLSISRSLARGMGGDLTVESVHGVGSTFRFTLPAVVVE